MPKIGLVTENNCVLDPSVPPTAPSTPYNPPPFNHVINWIMSINQRGAGQNTLKFFGNRYNTCTIKVHSVIEIFSSTLESTPSCQLMRWLPDIEHIYCTVIFREKVELRGRKALEIKTTNPQKISRKMLRNILAGNPPKRFLISHAGCQLILS